MRSGPLWLDEALSVEIARLPLAEVPGALRQDGAPPLYYLLLKGWMSLFGDGTATVRLLSASLVPVALLLVHRLGGHAGGRAGARAGVIVLATLPWTMRYGSETRMYALVVVLVLAGALALRAVHASGSRRAVAALAACGAALLLTHYWSLFLLTAVALVHLPGFVRGHAAARRVAAALVLAGVLFSPWLPTLLFQTAHTGAPWADPVTPVTLLATTPRFWAGGRGVAHAVLAALLVALAVVAVVRLRPARPVGAVVLLTLLLALTSVTLGGGAYTARYTAVVVPLVALLVGGGALALGGRRRPVLALLTVAATGVVLGVQAAGHPRGEGMVGAAAAVRAAGAPGDVVVYCPDQLGPSTARELGPGYDQVVYPTLGPPQRIDWVDYGARQAAADPQAIAARLDARAAGRAVLVLAAPGYRTYEGHCEALVDELTARRGTADRVFGHAATRSPRLLRFPPR